MPSTALAKLSMEPTVGETLSRAVGGSGVDLLMRIDNGLASLSLADAITEISDEFPKRPDLGVGRNIAVEIPDKTDAKGDVVQIVACNMASVELGRPAVPYLDLSIAGTMPVTDDEMVGESVFHVTDAEMIDVKNTGISLAGAAVVNDHIFPAPASHGRMINGGTGGGTQVCIRSLGAAAKEPTEEPRGGGSCRGRGGFDSLISFDAGLLNGDRGGGRRSMGKWKPLRWLGRNWKGRLGMSRFFRMSNGWRGVLKNSLPLP